MAYILLALSGLLPAVWLMARRRDPALPATWFAAAGVVMLADWLAFGIYHLYDYMPGLAADPGLDSMLGVVLAEVLFVSSAAMLQAALLPGWTGPAAATGLFLLIEWLFLRWGIFWQKGWPIWYSGLLFPLYFWLAGWFYHWAREEGLARGGARFLFRVLLIFLLVSLYSSVLRVGELMETNLMILPHDAGNGSLVRLLFFGMISAPVGLWVLMAGHVARWWRLAGAVILLAGLLYLTDLTGVMGFRPTWHPLLEALGQGITFGFAFPPDDWVARLASEQRRPARQ